MTTLKQYSDMLIQRGIAPGLKKYEKVRPRGIYMLMPSMWRKAKELEQATDMTYDRLMNLYKTAIAKQELSQRLPRAVSQVEAGQNASEPGLG